MYSLNIRWVKSQINPEVIEETLSAAGDWMRFDAWSWLIYSNYSAHDIASALRGKLLPEDNIVIIGCNPNDYSGFAQPWVWDWINKYRTPIAGLGGLGMVPPPNALSSAGKGLGMVPPSSPRTNPSNTLGNALSNLLSPKRPLDPS
jgi:hypothetical protein